MWPMTSSAMVARASSKSAIQPRLMRASITLTMSSFSMTYSLDGLAKVADAEHRMTADGGHRTMGATIVVGTVMIGMRFAALDDATTHPTVEVMMGVDILVL
jgi:hypothetical protein